MACENVEKCSILTEYGEKEEYKQAIKGFRSIYCEGDKQEECIRKKIASQMGGPDKLPANMMPNGLPLAGTDKSQWPQEVIDAVNEQKKQ